MSDPHPAPLSTQPTSPHESMRRPRLLLTALLLVAVAAPGVLGTTMCKVDADFDGAVNLGDLGLGSPGSTCSSTSTYWLGAERLNQPSWNDVTCDALLSTTYTAGSGTRTVAQDLEEGGVGAACCGSLAKVRCFDSSNMCKVDADFNGAVDLGALGLGGPDSTCSSHIDDSGWLGVLGPGGSAAASWSDVTCDALLSATYIRDGQMMHIAADIGRVGAACCGSIAKTRCFDASTMCKVDADFIGTKSETLLVGPTCAAAAPYALVNWAGKLSWNDVNDATCQSMASTPWGDMTGLHYLRVLGGTCCGSDAKTRCVDSSNMCKLDTDFKEAAASGVTLAGAGEGGADLSLTCGGTYGIATLALSVLSNATQRGTTMKWSDASCADMTKDLTPYFNSEFMHALYLKGTMKEFFETYGAACCGGLAKTRDPCEVLLAAPARANSGSVLSGGQHVLLTVLSWPSPQVAAAAPPTTTTPAPSPPASTAMAATDTKYFVTMTVTMPYRSVCADSFPRSSKP